MAIESINSNLNGLNRIAADSLTGKQTGNQVTFGDTIKDFLETVSNAQNTADQKMKDVIQGRSENLLEAITAMEESSLNFQLMLEIRNKLLEAYQEVSRVQV